MTTTIKYNVLIIYYVIYLESVFMFDFFKDRMKKRNDNTYPHATIKGKFN